MSDPDANNDHHDHRSVLRKTAHSASDTSANKAGKTSHSASESD